jgi:hypothetical protein
MQVVSQRAMQMADQATAMANRGMLYSAQTELIQSLAMIAQALDVQTGASRHGTALNAGMMALSEAREFAATNVRGGEPVNIGAIAAGHRTLVLRGHTGTELSPVVAQQQYFGYAQNQLAVAAGNVAAGSQILYRLGRLQTIPRRCASHKRLCFIRRPWRRTGGTGWQRTNWVCCTPVMGSWPKRDSC